MRTRAELRQAYEEGATIEELALEEGTYDGKIRKLLRDAGTTMRSKGSRPGTVRRKTQDPNVPRPTGVHRVSQLGAPPRKGYRRRGRKV